MIVSGDFPAVERPHISHDEMVAYVDGTADAITVEIVQGMIETDAGFASAIDAMQDAKADLTLTGECVFAPPQRRSLLASWSVGQYPTLGVHAHDFSDESQAERLYRTALAEHPDMAEPAFNLASFLFHVKGDADEAEKLYRRALELQPNEPSTCKELGTLLYRSRAEAEEAARLYRHAVEMAPDDPAALNNLGTILLDEKGELGEAERLYQRAVELEPENGAFHANLAGAYYEQGKQQEASEAACRAASLGCREHWVFDGLGIGLD